MPQEKDFIFLAWLNYFFSFIFSEPFLYNASLILSIGCSLVYLFKQLKSKKNEKDSDKFID
jgi:hypothetical protein